jgi:Transposase zinc-binding domain
MTAIGLCRTAALGGHIEQCDHCDHQRISYNSCIMGKLGNGELSSCVTGAAGFPAAFALHYDWSLRKDFAYMLEACPGAFINIGNVGGVGLPGAPPALRL